MILGTHSETEELGNGKFRLTQHLKPIAYLQNGAMKRVNFSLGDSGDPALTVGSNELIDIRIRPKLSGNAPVVHFGKGNSMLRFTPMDTNNVEGIVKGNEFIYKEAWNNADLKLVYGGHFLRKEVILRKGHPASFAFRIYENNLFDEGKLSTPDFYIQDPMLEKDGELTVPLKWDQARKGGKLILTVNLPTGEWDGWTLDPTLTLQPDAAAGQDNFIMDYVGWTNRNFGVTPYLDFGHYSVSSFTGRTLIKFDLSSLDGTEVITSATLSTWLRVSGSTLASNNRTHYIYRQKRAWVEGTRDGVNDSPATGATWVRYDTTNNWSTAGGFHTDDCEQSSIGSCAFATADSQYAQKDFTLTPTSKADIDLGNGWMIKGSVESADMYQICSSDHATAAYRPKLTVVYEAGGGTTNFYRSLLGVGK